jgi:hypothetical protein
MPQYASRWPFHTSCKSTKFVQKQNTLLCSRLPIQRIEELVAISVPLCVKPNQLAKLQHLPASAGLIRQPLRQAWSVGVAGFRKIGPVRRHCISQLAIGRLPWPAAHHMEIVEDVINLSEVIDARRCEWIKGELGCAGRSAREIVSVDWRPAACRSPFRPGPTAISNDFIAEQCR